MLETENKRICQISGLKSGSGRLTNLRRGRLRKFLEIASKGAGDFTSDWPKPPLKPPEKRLPKRSFVIQRGRSQRKTEHFSRNLSLVMTEVIKYTGSSCHIKLDLYFLNFLLSLINCYITTSTIYLK